MRKVLVTGGNGFIAGHVIEHLINHDIEVVTNIRSSQPEPFDFISDDDFEKLDTYRIDMRDDAGIYSLCEKVEGVIHLAGLLGTRHVDDVWKYYETNVKGALNVLDACTELQIPMIGIAVGNWFETNNYSNSKYAAEREMIKYAKYKGTKVNVVRGLNAFGPRQKVYGTGKIIPTFVTKALNDTALPVYGGRANCGIMDMIYVKDLAAIMVNELISLENVEKETGQIFEAGTGIGMPVYKIAEKIIKLSGSKSEIVEVTMRAGESNRSMVVANNPYDMEYTDFDQALGETIRWYRENTWK